MPPVSVFNSVIRGVASWYVFRVLGSLAAGVWKYDVTMDDDCDHARTKSKRWLSRASGVLSTYWAAAAAC